MRPTRRSLGKRLRTAGVALLLPLALSHCADTDAGSGGRPGQQETGGADASRLFGGVGPASGEAGEAGTRSPPVQRDTTPPRRRSAGRSDVLDVTELGYDQGRPDAPIRVIEFSDFGCGYCRKFHVETFPTLAEEFIEPGKVVWKYVPFVLGMFPNAVEAANAGECAGEQGRFAAVRDRLFEEQAEWRKAGDPFEVFYEYAEEEGLDAARFRACVEEGWMADRVRRSVQAGHRLGVRGTPTFVVNGFPLQGALPVSVFRDIFQRLLEEEAGPAGPG